MIDEKLLEELRQKLLDEKEYLEKEIKKMTHVNADGILEVNYPEDLGYDDSENANEVEEYAERVVIVDNLQKRLEEVNDALKRMDDGTYGVDVITGEEIDIERLKACPSAKTNVR